MPKYRVLVVALMSLLSIAGLNAQVTVDFNADVTEGCGSLQVSFSDNSTSTAGSIVSWSWNLGGVSSSLQNPGRIFGTLGSYEICLTVEDSGGNTGTLCKPDFITVYELPTPDLVASVTAGCIPLEVTFTDQSTSPSNVVEWIWDVGGTAGVINQTGSTEPITTTYEIADDYSINLIVRDEHGCESILNLPSYIIVNDEPVIDISVDNNFSCAVPFSANFSNNNIEAGVSYTWDFGNGIVYTGANPPAVNYFQQGTYTVSIVAENTVTGCLTSEVFTDYIQVGHPIDFTVDQTQSCVGVPVQFTNTSGVTADVITWDFGDGNTSNLANPSHMYTSGGCYTITLSIEIGGCVTTKSTNNCLNVFDNPTVNYAQDNPIGCTVPHQVNFTSTSTSIGLITGWEWDFGEGNTSNIENPTHTYTSFGNFPVSLRVTDSNGCETTLNTETVQVQPVQASIPFGLMNGCQPLTVTLNDNSSSLLPITAWSWEIYTAETSPPTIVHSSTNQNPSFSILDTGTYHIVLEVASLGGCVDRDTFPRVIEVGMEAAIAFDATPRANCVNTPTLFENNSSDFTDEYIWDFGDGQFSEEEEPSHEYVDTGFFNVTLVAIHNGCPNVVVASDFVQILPPIASGAVTIDCDNPYDRIFDNNSVGADSIIWDFGNLLVADDTTTNKDVTTYTFPTTGIYDAELIAYNFTTGCTDTIAQVIEITDPEAGFVIGETTGCNPLTVIVSDTSHFASTYLWSGAGATFSDNTVAEPQIIFNNAGTFSDIVLEIEDINGCRDTFLFPDEIFVNGISADANFPSAGGCTPFNAQMFDNSSDLFGNVISWDWNVGNGLYTSTDQNPSFQIDSLGIFDVVLTIVDDIGCTETTTFPDAIQVTQPAADFESDTLTCTQRQIQFFSLSSGVNLSYEWDFGDGNTSTIENPIYNYTVEGIYDVCLTVRDLFNCDSTLCKTNYVTVADPVASFSQDTTFASCPPLIVNFENNSLNALNYEWTFGDDSGNSNSSDPAHVYVVPGTYDVTLVARSTEYCQDTLVKTDLISLLGPIGEFSIDTLDGCAAFDVTFVGNSIEPYNFIWDFGNGVLDTTMHVDYDSLTYKYKSYGKYVPKLILEDDQGCQRTLESPVEISVEDIIPDFQAQDSIFCNETNVSTLFYNSSFSTNAINYNEWIFEGADNPSSTLIEPSATYSTPGTYDVTLIVESDYCRDTIVKQNFIRIGDVPNALFDMSQPISCTNDWVSFTDQSTVIDANIDTWAWNFGDGDFSTTNNPNHLFQEAGTFDVELTVGSDIGCTDSISQTISISELPSAELAGDNGICIGNLARLEAVITSDTTGISYTWQSSPTLNCNNCLDPLADPTVTTTYTFIAQNNGGCVDSFDIIVEVLPFQAPVVNITPDGTICENEFMALSASGGQSVYDYNWDQSAEGLTCYEACNNPLANPTTSTIYTVTVTNDVGCSSIDSVLVDVISQSQEFVGPNRIICEGDTVNLATNTGSNPNWIVAEGLSCAYCPDPVATPAASINYVVEVTTDEGCAIYDSIFVEVVHPEDVDAGLDQIVCSGEEVLIEGSGQGQATWTSSVTSVQNQSFLTLVTYPQVNTVYYLSMEYGDCVLTDSVSIEVIDKTEIEGLNDIICFGDTAQLIFEGDANSFLWLDQDNNVVSNQLIPNVQPEETALYTVIAQNSTCEPDTSYATIEVIGEPEVYLTSLYEFFPGQNVHVQVQTNGDDYSYEWTAESELSCLDCPNPIVFAIETKEYTVRITEDLTGCSTERQTVLALLESCGEDIISVPNVFSPNGDGENDVLYIYSSAINEIENFRIFNRWGSVVFETTNLSEGWDGYYKGSNAPDGVYVFMIEAKCDLTGDTFIVKGDITIIK